MPKIEYIVMNFKDWKNDLIKKVNSLIADYKAQGYELTLRQVYYQFVARDWLPEKWIDPKTGSKNNLRSYDNLGELINTGRLAGMIDWHAIEDRTRELTAPLHFKDPGDRIRTAARNYGIDLWEGQKNRVEVWVEKDALEGIVARVCSANDVAYLSCRGFTSQTAMWDAGQRLKAIAKSGVTPVIVHLGDFDPSGVDMSRDIQERITMFMDGHGTKLKFERVALNMDQVDQYKPPPNPAKTTDSRAAKFIEQYGDQSWELDALDPAVISEIVEKSISKYRDGKKYNARHARQESERGLLTTTAQFWGEVSDYVRENFDIDDAPPEDEDE